MVDQQAELGMWRRKGTNFTELRQLSSMALIDPLTGLYNRRGLFGDHKKKPPIIGQLDEIYSSTKRYEHDMTVMMLDLDYFKDYNDKHGHQKADELLQKFALISRGAVREYDILGRYGGEEFLFIFPETNINQGKKIAEQIQKALKDNNLRTTVSMGISSHNGKRLPPKEVFINEADAALYLAKHSGRNCFKTRGDVLVKNKFSPRVHP